MATKMASVASVVLKLDFTILRKVFGVERSVIHVFTHVVNKIVDILLSNPENFKLLFLCMGPFHMVRILQKCAGKLLRGSGRIR